MATKKTRAKKSEYSAKSIQVLEGLEPVRKRPGMYIGGTSVEGLHHLIWEVVSNSIDEAMAGYGKYIEVRLLEKNRISVSDEGRGIPVDKHKQTKLSALETVMTKLHAGGKFGGDDAGYKVSGGLHGVGVSVVNALSVWTKAEVHQKGKMWIQEYTRGKANGKLKAGGKTNKTGTIISFEPDPDIFPKIEWNWSVIVKYLRQQAYLTKGVYVKLVDETGGDPEMNRKVGFCFDGGIKTFVKFMNRNREPINKHMFYIEKESDGMLVEVALQYHDAFKEHVLSFTNNINTTEGGMHETGFRTALTRSINDYARKNNILRNKEDNLTSDDVREGLTAVVSVKLQDPQFEGQTKTKLGNSEARTITNTIVSEGLIEYFEKNPQDAKAIIGKGLLSAKARLAAKAAKDAVVRKGALEGLTLPGKLSDCSSRDASKSELYIVEGDSAGGCFDDKTKVALADGRSLNFLEIIKEQEEGKKNYCYTVKKDGSVGIEKIVNARRTKRNAQVIRITLDNGKKMVCTPNHPFMLKNGSYKKAKSLLKNDSLMPLRKKLSKKEKRITILDKSLKMMKVVYDNHGKISEDIYNKYRKRKNDKSVIRLSTISERFFDGDRKKMEEAAVNYNHKIRKIEFLKERSDVFDLEVPGTHNFALESGVFVHNSAKQGRDRQFQAILPLRGKILNVERARLDRMLSSAEIKSLVIALGVGVGDRMNIEKLRYHRIIIMTDADVDGSHIRTLLLTLLYRHFEELITRGHVYIAQPPLYQLKRGNEVYYVFTDEEKDKVLKKMSKDTGKKKRKDSKGDSDENQKTMGIIIQRYKGLGEMNPAQLWETTMNPETRKMYQVVIEDAQRADKAFKVMMGNEVEPRKRFIQARAKSVLNLDV